MRFAHWLIPIASVLFVFGAMSGLSRSRPASVLKWSVKIDVPGGSGSGTIIGNARYDIAAKPVTFSLVLTCGHVVTLDFTKPPPRRIIVTRDGKTYGATVVALSKRHDLALLLVHQDWPKAPMFFGDVHAGQREIVAGAALGTNVGLTDGYFGQWDSHAFKGRRIRQGSAAVWPGNSGGGVFVDRGGWKLVGVMEVVPAIGPYHMLVPEVSMFIPMADVSAFLRANGLS